MSQSLTSPSRLSKRAGQYLVRECATTLLPYLPDRNCPASVGCQRTFWTQDVCWWYDRTTASSSSSRRSNSFTVPSAKLAKNVDDDPLSDISAVTGLSALVSRSFRERYQDFDRSARDAGETEDIPSLGSRCAHPTRGRSENLH